MRTDIRGKPGDLLWEELVVGFLRWAKTSLSGDHSTRKMGRLAQVHVGEDPPLDLEQGTP